MLFSLAERAILMNTLGGLVICVRNIMRITMYARHHYTTGGDRSLVALRWLVLYQTYEQSKGGQQ